MNSFITRSINTIQHEEPAFVIPPFDDGGRFWLDDLSLLYCEVKTFSVLLCSLTELFSHWGNDLMMNWAAVMQLWSDLSTFFTRPCFLRSSVEEKMDCNYSRIGMSKWRIMETEVRLMMGSRPNNPFELVIVWEKPKKISFGKVLLFLVSRREKFCGQVKERAFLDNLFRFVFP